MKNTLLLLCSIVFVSTTSANEKKIVECRFLTPKTTECKPYPSRFMYTDKLSYGGPRHKLIISKTLPPRKRPKLLKIISVEDMIENNLKVLEPVRYSRRYPNQMELQKERRKREEAYIKEIKLELASLRKKREQLLVQKRKLKEEIASITELEKKQPGGTGIKEESTAKSKGSGKKPIIVKKKAAKKKKREAKKSKLAIKLEKKFRYLNKKTRNKMLNEYDTKLLKVTPKGKHRLRVQATAYSSHAGQTDKTPFLAAWNNRIRPGMKIIAVSRDLITKYGLGNGKKVKIQGLPGYYTVRDKMNKRFTKRIDIYMGTNRRKALRWGRRRTIIYW